MFRESKSCFDCTRNLDYLNRDGYANCGLYERVGVSKKTSPDSAYFSCLTTKLRKIIGINADMLIKKQQTSKNKQKNEKLTCILPKTRNKASFTLKSWQYCQKFNVKPERFNKNATYVLPKSANSGKNKEWRYNLLDISLTSPDHSHV